MQTRRKTIAAAIAALGLALSGTAALAQTAPPPAGQQDPQAQQPGQMQPGPGGAAGETLTEDQWTEIEGMTVTDAQGEEIGDVSRLVESLQDQRPYAVLSVGGFLGIGDTEVAVPLEDLRRVGDELMLTTGDTREQIEQRADEFRAEDYREIGGGDQGAGN